MQYFLTEIPPIPQRVAVNDSGALVVIEAFDLSAGRRLYRPVFGGRPGALCDLTDDAGVYAAIEHRHGPNMPEPGPLSRSTNLDTGADTNGLYGTEYAVSTRHIYALSLAMSRAGVADWRLHTWPRNDTRAAPEITSVLTRRLRHAHDVDQMLAEIKAFMVGLFPSIHGSSRTYHIADLVAGSAPMAKAALVGCVQPPHTPRYDPTAPLAF